MSLVASRFHAWTKPKRFYTVIVRRHDDWMQRISDCLLPNACFVRILALDLAFTQDWCRGQLSSEELTLIQQFLESARQVKHLAVTWNIWAQLQHECGALQLESLYLIWDGAFNIFPAGKIRPPVLDHLQYPAVLEHLTVSAPTALDNPTPWAPLGGRLYLPATMQCVKLTSVTYATARLPGGGLGLDVKYTMLVLLERTEPEEWEQEDIQKDKENNPNYSVVCMPDWDQVLVAWVAKTEGRESILNHPVGDCSSSS
ncbi:hypothetical protein B0H13DRAFT_2393853 [Mycena leptocephala]|nr:hypothetical protein B0H13DRAFT_2393853 [Mycena leptocephala]